MTISRPFAYTNRDFGSLRADMRRRMLVAIPEWTAYEAGFESILLDMFAYVGDIENFYIDRMGAEAYIQKAVLRESMLDIAAMFGYVPAAQTAASCTVQFTKSPTVSTSVIVPVGTVVFAQVEGQAPVYFETVAATAGVLDTNFNAAGDLIIPAGSFTGSVSAVEGQTVRLEAAGTSTGTASQAFLLFNPNVIRDSVHVFTLDGPPDPLTGATQAIEWTYFQRIIDANFGDRAFSFVVDEDLYTYILFGDGVSGVIPSTNSPILVTYRYGVGLKGNLGIGAVRSLFSGGLLSTQITSVSNTTASTGGLNAESIEAMRYSIPKSLTSLERAVSLADYAALALRVAGVVKSSATATLSTAVTVYIAPAGGGQPSANLLTLVAAYFNGPPARSMIGTSLTFAGPTYVPINITVSLTVNARYRQDTVKLAVTNAITAFFAFNNRSFDEIISKAMLFRAIIDIAGVDYVDVTTFSRTGSGTADVDLAINEIATLGTLAFTLTGGIVLL